MKPTTRAFISTTFRSTAAVLVGFATKPEVRETFDSQLNKIKYEIITIPELQIIRKVSD